MRKSSGCRSFPLSEGVEVEWAWGNEALQNVDWTELDHFYATERAYSVFLDTRMIRALLSSPERPLAILRWRRAGRLIGVAVVEDTCAESVGLEAHISSERPWFRWVNRMLHGKDNRFQFQVRVVGTVLGSGTHDQVWASDVNENHARRWLNETIFETIQLNGKSSPRVVMVKDDPILDHQPRRVKHPGWIPLEFDPEMLLHLDPEWKDIESYKAAMKTKGRTKINRILAISDTLEMKAWDLGEIEQQGHKLIALYQQIYERSGFRLGSLHHREFVESKRAWGDDFVVNGFYLVGELVGFQCAYVGVEETEAFFVGFDPEFIKTHAIYQRMLVEFIRIGLERGSKRVNMGRTALEIKSSVGALPRRLQCEVRFKNRLFHEVVRRYTRGYDPVQPVMRQPWKQDAYPPKAHLELHSA